MDLLFICPLAENCISVDDLGLWTLCPDADDCTAYYACVYEDAYHFQCAPGEEWDQEAVACVEPIEGIPCSMA